MQYICGYKVQIITRHDGVSREAYYIHVLYHAEQMKSGAGITSKCIYVVKTNVAEPVIFVL